MAGKALSNLAIVMGIIVVLADLYWIATSYAVALWLALGIIILVASIIWLVADIKMRSGG